MIDLNENIIYQIKCLSNNKIYIGSTNYYERRIKDHLRQLKKDKHPIEAMQKDFNTYGIGNFSFSIVEKNNDTQKEKREYEIINSLSKYESLYNSLLGVSTIMRREYLQTLADKKKAIRLKPIRKKVEKREKYINAELSQAIKINDDILTIADLVILVDKYNKKSTPNPLKETMNEFRLRINYLVEKNYLRGAKHITPKTHFTMPQILGNDLLISTLDKYLNK